MNISDITRDELRAVATNARTLAIDATQALWPSSISAGVGPVEQFEAEILMRLCVEAALRDFQFGRR